LRPACHSFLHKAGLNALSMLQATLNLLTMHLPQNNFSAITPACIVTANDVKTQEELNNASMDIYIGVSPNVL
jgi:hypothetical protein